MRINLSVSGVSVSVVASQQDSLLHPGWRRFRPSSSCPIAVATFQGGGSRFSKTALASPLLSLRVLEAARSSSRAFSLDAPSLPCIHFVSSSLPCIHVDSFSLACNVSLCILPCILFLARPCLLSSLPEGARHPASARTSRRLVARGCGAGLSCVHG
jgi:hypothetical protein